MPWRSILLIVLALGAGGPIALAAQSACIPGPVRDSLLGSLVYLSCKTDRAPRPRGPLALHRYPEVLQAAGIGFEDAVVVVTIDSLGRPISGRIGVAARWHPLWRKVIQESINEWQFVPGEVEGRSVAVLDSVVLNLVPLGVAPFPRGCVDCDPALEAARTRVLNARAELIACARALERIASREGTDSIDWAYRRVTGCPGAGAAAALLIAQTERSEAWYGVPRQLDRLVATVHDTLIFDAALAAARRGHRFAYRLLAYQITDGWARLADSVRVPWDQLRQRPKGGCGPLRVTTDGRPVPGPPVDLRRYLTALLVVDSVIAAPGTDDDLRSTAWCPKANHL